MDVPIGLPNEKISGNIMFPKFMNLKEILNLENVGHFDGKSKGILDWRYSRFTSCDNLKETGDNTIGYHRADGMDSNPDHKEREFIN